MTPCNHKATIKRAAYVKGPREDRDGKRYQPWVRIGDQCQACGDVVLDDGWEPILSERDR